MRVLLLATIFLIGSEASPVHHTPNLEEVIEGGEVLGDIMFVSTAEVLAPLMDATVKVLEVAARRGKHSLNDINEMIHGIHTAPEMKQFVKQMEKDIQFLELSLDEFERSAKLTAFLIKATADCVAPHHDLLDKISASTLKDVEEIVDIERDAVRDVIAASYSVEEEVNHLQAIENQIFEAMMAGDVEKANEVAAKHKTEAEKEAKAIQRTFISATDDFSHELTKALEKLGDTLEHVQMDGAKLMHTVETCLAPKMKHQMSNSRKTHHKTNNN